jgi:DUF971 family protein
VPADACCRGRDRGKAECARAVTQSHSSIARLAASQHAVSIPPPPRASVVVVSHAPRTRLQVVAGRRHVGVMRIEPVGHYAVR